MQTTKTANAQPTKLRDGSWGIRTNDKIASGDAVVVKARSGKVWTATVTSIVWTGQDRYNDGKTVTLAKTKSGSPRRTGRSGCPECGNPRFNGVDMCLSCLYSPA